MPLHQDKTPARIEVWVCPECGYWRQEKSTGRHQIFPDRFSRGVAHELVRAVYAYEDCDPYVEAVRAAQEVR